MTEPEVVRDATVRHITHTKPIAPSEVRQAVRPGAVAISDADPELSQALCSAFQALGVSAEAVGDPAAVHADLIVLTEGASQFEITERHWRALEACQALRAKPVRIVLLGRADDKELEFLSGLHGLSRTLRREWPDAQVSALNVSSACRAPEIAGAMLAEFTEAVLVPEGLQVVQLTANTFSGAGTSALPDGTWLISGGARGVTANCAIELARQLGSGTFVLVGRSELVDWPEDVEVCGTIKDLRGALVRVAKARGEAPRPAEIDRTAKSLLASQDIRKTLAAFSATGVEAHYLALDISDKAAVDRRIDDLVKAHGPVVGLVHGAGVLADGLAEKKTRSEVDKVFSAKVHGLLNLLGALDLDRLKYCGLFSSASAVFGNAGQSDYAMANAWLNAAARQLHRDYDSLHVKSFCWGPWAGGMVDEALAASFADRGIPLIPLQRGAEIFVSHLLDDECDAVELLIGDSWEE